MTSSQNTIASILESLLFISGEPLSVAHLMKTMHVDEKTILENIEILSQKYIADQESGLMIVRKEKAVALGTKPENAAFVEALTKATLTDALSKAALEVLSIIVYRAPITRAEIEAVRGVNCSFTLRNLLLRDLIERSGNPADARGYVYAPTFRFLQSLGIGKVEELPEYETLSSDERLKMILKNEEDIEKEEGNQESLTVKEQS
ncbi:MAG: SMC-Scp complex subunit ScpB [Candidatus Moranbacteria bacterium]|nr:SMC-Scp complex subunit ScpB [Candidatus Moranbacteria bacterium]